MSENPIYKRMKILIPDNHPSFAIILQKLLIPKMPSPPLIYSILLHLNDHVTTHHVYPLNNLINKKKKKINKTTKTTSETRNEHIPRMKTNNPSFSSHSYYKNTFNPKPSPPPLSTN